MKRDSEVYDMPKRAIFKVGDAPWGHPLYITTTKVRPTNCWGIPLQKYLH